MDVAREVARAEDRVRPYIQETPLERSHHLSRLAGANVYLKLENLQRTGSFKVRGALNKVLSLTELQRKRGIVTASTGNHGAAVAFSLREVGGAGIVFVPETASPAKLEAIRQWGAEVRTHGTDCAETEAHARTVAQREGLTYVSPYNDPQVIGGQGTIGIELDRQLDHTDVVFVPLGGGGLVSGVGGYLKSVRHDITIIGCSPENSQVMIQSVAAGRILDLPSLPTLSDATAGGIEAGSITFPLCRDLVDEYVTVTEEEIKKGLQVFSKSHDMMIEGAAAVAVASYLRGPGHFAGKNIVIIVSGGNIDPAILEELV